MAEPNFKPRGTSVQPIALLLTVWPHTFNCASEAPQKSLRLSRSAAIEAVYGNFLEKTKPEWLDQARHFCRPAGIRIVAWGPSVLCVEAKSPARASGAASQLATLGFKPIASEDDAKAGILSLSKDPDVIQAKITSFDLSRRRWDERIEPLIWAGYAIVFLAPQVLAIAHVIRRGSLSHLAQGLLSLLLEVRMWGWRIEIVPSEIRVWRAYRWTAIRWNQIVAVESIPANWGRDQESVLLKVESCPAVTLGTFACPFARNLQRPLASRTRPALPRQRWIGLYFRRTCRKG